MKKKFSHFLKIEKTEIFFLKTDRKLTEIIA